MAAGQLLDQLDVSLLYRLFGLEREMPSHVLLDVAQQVGGSLPQLVLTVADRAGERLGSGSQDLLARARARAADYADLAADLPTCQAVKGPSLSRHFPADFLRPVGDLDLVVPTEADLWRAAVRVTQLRPIRATAVILHGSPEPIPFVVLEWPAPDPWLDRPLKVEITVTPLVGNFGAVGLRQLDTSALGWYTDVVTLCEERFQRPFNPKDLADVLAIGQSRWLDPARIAEVAAAHHLAPELQTLLSFASRHCDIGPLTDALRLVSTTAKRERARRERWIRPAVADHIRHPVRQRLAGGQPARAVRLTSGRPEGPPVELRDFGAHLLYRTPVGDFLVTTDEMVGYEDYQAALAEVGAARAGAADV